MNIIINSACNLRCPYCFEGNMRAELTQNMTYDDFKDICDFISTSTTNRKINIIGGEPAIHPQFKEMLVLATQYVETYQLEMTIFTNGIEMLPYMDYVPARASLLVNANSPLTMPKKSFEKMLAFFKEASERGWNRTDQDEEGNTKTGPRYTPYATPGCNLYEGLEDYDYFWKILDDYNFNRARVSVSSPRDMYYRLNREKYFEVMKDRFIQFVVEARKRNLAYLAYDCNLHSYCHFTGDELMLIDSLTLEPNDVFRFLGCVGSIEGILPDGQVSGCFGDKYFELLKKPYKEFQTYQEIMDYLDDVKDRDMPKTRLEKCEGCRLAQFGCTAGCTGFLDGVGYRDGFPPSITQSTNKKED